MKKIFVDDKRNLDEAIKSGYICVQSYKNCIMLLSIYKKVIIILYKKYTINYSKRNLIKNHLLRQLYDNSKIKDEKSLRGVESCVI